MNINTLIENNYQLGLEEGRRTASSIDMGESNYGATQTAIVAVEFTSFQALRNAIRDRRSRRSGDNPGQIYMWTCELIHIHHTDYSKVALLKCATHRDI